MLDLRQMLTGAYIRAVAGIRDVGEIFESVVGGLISDNDDPNYTTDDRDSLWTAAKHVLSGQKHLARVFSPFGILWHLPHAGDRALVIRPQHNDGPGQTWLLPIGQQNTDSYPDWLDDSNSGFYTPRALHIESTGGAVTIQANTGGSNAAPGRPVGASATFNSDGSVEIRADQNSQSSIAVDKFGAITINAGANQTLSLVANGTGSISLSADALTGAVKLGPVGIYPVLVLGSVDSLGVPVQQLPAAVNTIVKAG